MSKLFSSKKLILKPIRQTMNNDYLNQSMQNIIEPYTKGSQSISSNFSSFNKNNITMDYSRHYSPQGKSFQSLPPINDKNRKNNNSQKKAQKRLNNSSSTQNLYSQSIFGPNTIKKLEREKTEINVIENNFEKIKRELNSIEELDDLDTGTNMNNANNINNLKNNGVTQINNITNINIHIYQADANNASNKTIGNIDKNDLTTKNASMISEFNNYPNLPSNSFINDNSINPNNISYQNSLFKTKNNISNDNFPPSFISKAGLSIINSNNSNISQKKVNNISSFFSKNSEKNKKGIKGNIKILPSNSPNSPNISKFSNKITNNSMSSIGSLIMNNNNINNNISTNKQSSRVVSQNKIGNNRYNPNSSLPEINKNRSISMNKKNLGIENNLNVLLKEEKNNNDNNIENIDISMNFLKDLSNNTSNFVSFLQLIQTHMDIELLFESTENTGNNLFKRKILNTMNNDKILKLNKLLNTYFNNLSSIYLKNENVPIPNILGNAPIDNFFLYQSINAIFHKSIKIQICLFCAILITLTQLSIFDINTMMKNHFHQIIKDALNPLLNIFDVFIKEEINLNYPELITINLRPDFNEHFNKLHKIPKYMNNCKNSELISLILKNLDKCVNSIKYYSTLNLKYSTIKPFGDALNQLLFSIDRKNLNQISTIVLSTILFGELEANRNRAIQNCLASNLNLINKLNNGLIGSSISNNIKDTPPFLPPINPKYKYTLILDMDETLIHYFFTHINGMFFVRPYCFNFLRELNEIYEIVTFTAGTKEYADNILNILDIDNNIIKYRLYRQHTTILGCSIYKDLSKIGRDLSKVIIIDNLKENFKMQPNNGIFIKTWTNDINDVQFKDLLKILKDIVALNVFDVRPVIQKMNDEIKISRNIIRPYLNINISKLVG